MSKEQIVISGPDAEDFIKFLEENDDSILGEIDVERQHAHSHGFAREPQAASVLLVAGVAIYPHLLSLLKQWMMQRDFDKASRNILAAFAISREAGQVIQEIEKARLARIHRLDRPFNPDRFEQEIEKVANELKEVIKAGA